MYKIGIDIVKINRIEKILKRNEAFLYKNFSKIEIMQCKGKKNFYESLAARYAAKEAYIKASNDFDTELINIEIINEKNNKPKLYINGQIIKGEISLSHDGNYAIANVIIEK